MRTVVASAGATVSAAPEQVLMFLTDLAARPQILTSHYSAFTVLDGSVIAYHFRAGRRERDYRLACSRNGSTVSEKDQLSSFVNTWEVTPAGSGSRVTLTGTWASSSARSGFLEGIFAPLGFKRIYTEILTKLNNVVSKRGTPQS